MDVGFVDIRLKGHPEKMALSREEIRKIYDAGFEAVCAVIQSLEKRIEVLEHEVTEIKTIIMAMSKNSRNSSKPPSSDGFQKPPRTRSQRESSGKSPGGQMGHDPFFLKPVDKPDKIVVHPADHCKNCGKSLENMGVTDFEKRQVFDLPPLQCASPSGVDFFGRGTA